MQRRKKYLPTAACSGAFHSEFRVYFVVFLIVVLFRMETNPVGMKPLVYSEVFWGRFVNIHNMILQFKFVTLVLPEP